MRTALCGHRYGGGLKAGVGTGVTPVRRRPDVAIWDEDQGPARVLILRTEKGVHYGQGVDPQPEPGRLDLSGLAAVGRLLRHARRVEVRGTIDGQEFQSSSLALRDGQHKLPRADVRKAIGKEAGGLVTVHLGKRLDG